MKNICKQNNSLTFRKKTNNARICSYTSGQGISWKDNLKEAAQKWQKEIRKRNIIVAVIKQKERRNGRVLSIMLFIKRNENLYNNLTVAIKKVKG